MARLGYTDGLGAAFCANVGSHALPRPLFSAPQTIAQSIARAFGSFAARTVARAILCPLGVVPPAVP